MAPPASDAASDAAPDPSPRFPAPALYLLDTMGYIFRAFHALPPFSNSKGQPTQAVLGVVNMVRKLVQDAQPAALAAVFDLAGPTFRDRDFAAYKANRPPMPETLAPQLPYIRRALEALRVPILECEGFEADDVIGTLARQAVARGGQVVIVSSDKDLLQLVDGGIWVYNPGRDLLMDAAAVEARLGVKPSQVADLLALRGDAVDNIPGAPGIGEKGAQQIIQRFGSVETALARAAEVERKSYRESLQNHAEQIRLSKALATIHTEAPVAYAAEAWLRQDPDQEACRALFTELEFHHLLRTLGDAGGAAAEPVPAIESEADAAAVLTLLHRNPHGPLALGWRADDPQMGLADAGAALAIPLALTAGMTEALADPQRHWQWFDSKAARAHLRKLGLPLPPLLPEQVDDLTLLAYLDDPTRGSFSFTPPPLSAAAEAAAVARTAATLRERVRDSGQLRVYADLDLPLVPVLEAMESTGVRLDPSPLADLSLELERRALACQEQVFELAGARFNLNSPAQLAEILFTRLALPPPARRGKSKIPSTAVDVLEELIAYPIGPPILEYRQLTKLKSTYVDALPPLLDPVTRRLHTTYIIAGSATGRLASINPNLQNIPIRTELGRQIRAAFVADPGYFLLSADYSQIELRLLAHFSQDPLLLQAYREGGDIHRLTAAEVFGVPPLLISDEHRRRAKAVNFGIVYGLSAFGLSRQLGIPQKEAAQFIARYFERYAGVKDYIAATLEQARREGRVQTMHGRIRPIPNLDSRNPTLRGFAERTAINTPLQGTAADLIKLAMIRLQPQLGALGARLLLQVHDELVLEVPRDTLTAAAALVRREMEGVAELAVPLRVELGAGENWRDLDDLASA